MHRATSAAISDLDIHVASGCTKPARSSVRFAVLMLICSVLLTGCLGTQAASPAAKSGGAAR